MRLPSPEVLRAAAARLPRLPAAPAAEGRIGVAVSGGADSVYLLCALWADETLRPRLVALHFDHRVRGEASEADALFVAGLASRLGVGCFIGCRASAGPASEGELRAARDAFFAEQRAAHGIRLLCTAHHLDDVAETTLLRLARGAGPSGLGAPRALQSFRDGHRRWRPLVAAGLAKADLLAALRAQRLPWREDATNLLPVAARNRVRAWLAVGGEAALGPDYRKGFALSARLADEATQALGEWARELGCVVAAGVMPVAGLRGRPEALAQECLREFLRHHGVADPGAASLGPLVAALRAGGEARAAVGGLVVSVRRGRLALAKSAPSLGTEERALRLGVRDEASGLLAEETEVGPGLWKRIAGGKIAPESEVYVQVARGGLAWRGRKPGDRYHPLGAPGSAKLSDILINRKVPADRREALPVVLSAGRILWVPGLPPAEFARLKGPAKGALRLTWHGPGLG